MKVSIGPLLHKVLALWYQSSSLESERAGNTRRDVEVAVLLRLLLTLSMGWMMQGAPGQAPPTDAPPKPLEKSAWFAYVDRDYIFTCEVTKPGEILFNFISMTDSEQPLAAKLVRVAFATRRVPATFFLIETGNPNEPVLVPSVKLRPRSSFGVQLKGDFPGERELHGVTVGMPEEDFKLVPMASFDFENLALKVNRLNLGSPDFDDDWRVLKLSSMGIREPVRRRPKRP